MDFSKSDALNARFHELVPGASHTYSKGEDQFPLASPKLIERAAGAYCWDVDGNRFLDWAMGNRVMILGHAHPVVNEAVRRQIDLGLNFTRPGVQELELAAQRSHQVGGAGDPGSVELEHLDECPTRV